jgi:predicted PurR-regulated permease PerM
MAVIGGGMLLGPAGAILALPAAAVVKALLDEFGPRPRHGAATGDADPQPSPGAPL